MDAQFTRLIERKLYKLNTTLEGFELYEATVKLIEGLVSEHLGMERMDKRKFTVQMMDWVNNAEWADKSKHSSRIQMIRDELSRIDEIGIYYGIATHY